MKLLEAEGVAFQRVDYFKQPFTEQSLSDLLTRAGVSPRQVLRKRAKEYRSLGLDDASTSEASILEALVAHPDLLERPIVEAGGRAVVARPVEKALTLL